MMISPQLWKILYIDEIPDSTGVLRKGDLLSMKEKDLFEMGKKFINTPSDANTRRCINLICLSHELIWYRYEVVFDFTFSKKSEVFSDI